ncbi:MAG TPA: OsmC family protein [Thermoanaerobaculia bacterium]|nr:OsmC family protein [Thermoanaerobaculia bacterium]
MSDHTAIVQWQRGDAAFVDNRYSRLHSWEFDGGIRVPASASPHVVPAPLSSAEAVDPEEAFVASLSSCHMLWFLSIAAKKGFVVDSYSDRAVGQLRRNGDGTLMMTDVVLRPAVRFGGQTAPGAEEIERLHHEAHDACFLAASVRTNVRVEPA